MRGNKDGPVEMATFDSPRDVAVDVASGSVYVADGGRSSLRVIIDGEVYTLDESIKLRQPEGIALLWDAFNKKTTIYVAEPHTNEVSALILGSKSSNTATLNGKHISHDKNGSFGLGRQMYSIITLIALAAVVVAVKSSRSLIHDAGGGPSRTTWLRAHIPRSHINAGGF